MSDYIYKITSSEAGVVAGSIVNLHTHEIRLFDSSNPLYDLIREYINSGDLENAFRCSDMSEYIKTESTFISENISYDSIGNLFFKESLLPSGITDTMLKAIKSGNRSAISALAQFVERVVKSATNTSKEALFSWIRDRSLSVSEDGCFIAYKGVTPSLKSITAGPGYVNGEEVHGHLDNSIGNVVSIDRNYVEQEVGEACGPGLHAGTYSFAESFSKNFSKDGVVVAVKIKPENVVSVPWDSNYQKLRVCEYEVIGVVEDESQDVLF